MLIGRHTNQPGRTTLRLLTLGLSISLMWIVSSCSKEDSDDDAAATTTTPTTGNTATNTDTSTDNELAVAFPSTLALSIFPQSVDGSSLTAETDAEEKSVKEKIQDRADALSGDVDSCFDKDLIVKRSAVEVKCYEFDNDLNSFNNGPAGSGGSADGKHTDGEACMVAFARQEIRDATQYVDRALGTVQALLCQIAKEGGDTTPPADGDGEVDYSSYLSEATGSTVTVNSATMEYIESTDGKAGYRTSVSITSQNHRMDMNIVYFKGDTDGEDSGIITYTSPAANPGETVASNDANNTGNMDRVVSVKFSREIVSDEPRNRFEVRKAHMLNTLDPFDDNGLVNFGAIPEADGNSTSNNMSLVAFDINPDNNEGQLSYWRNPGGSYTEAARGFVFDIEADDDGILSGCGVSGAMSNTSIRKSLATSTDLEPTGYWHPFASGNTHAQKDDRYTGGGQGALVTVQCFEQDSSGLYEIDYAATKAIDSTTTDSEVDAHGYDVIPVASNKIQPPTAPEGPPPGEFIEVE